MEVLYLSACPRNDLKIFGPRSKNFFFWNDFSILFLKLSLVRIIEKGLAMRLGMSEITEL
jgi:hypothetical protein